MKRNELVKMRCNDRRDRPGSMEAENTLTRQENALFRKDNAPWKFIANSSKTFRSATACLETCVTERLTNTVL